MKSSTHIYNIWRSILFVLQIQTMTISFYTPLKSILWNIFWNTQNNGLIICKSYFKSIILHVNIKYKSYALITQERKQLICNILVVWWFRNLLLEWVICFLLFIVFIPKKKILNFQKILQWEILAYPFCTILILPQLHKGCATPVPPCRYEFQMLWGMVYYIV